MHFFGEGAVPDGKSYLSLNSLLSYMSWVIEICLILPWRGQKCLAKFYINAYFSKKYNYYIGDDLYKYTSLRNLPSRYTYVYIFQNAYINLTHRTNPAKMNNSQAIYLKFYSTNINHTNSIS